MIEWPTVKLGDVADFLTGFPFKSASYSDAGSDPRLLRGDNIAQGTLRWDNAKRWPLTLTDDVSSYRLERGDIVLAMDRPWIDAGLKYATVMPDDLPSFLVQRVARLRGTRHLRTRFLRYVIGSRAFTDYILGVQTGTAVPHISGGQIKGYQFRLPPIPEQEQIAEVLGSLDDKIELNRRMNQTLEGMAQAIFRDWFVDFGPTRRKIGGATDPVEIMGGLVTDPDRARTLADFFPAALSDNGLPEGWREKGLDEIAEFLNGLALQKYPAKDDTDSLPVIKIAELRNGVSANTGRASRDVPSKYVVRDGDFLFSWSGSLLAKFWTEGEGALNQHLFKVSSDQYPAWFFSLWVHHHMESFRHTAASKATTMGHIQRSHLRAAKTACPPDHVVSAMTATLGPISEKAVQNSLENRTLTATRDLLLPKLMSGELRLRDAEVELEAAQ
ncbi:restriction endonuclease subunit S [Mesorhizobium sp. MSK_1335]|uniref:Restriction endonuclease subunit S n=1 Tax=Mesorhizobium montanum TaxID=3072323 RepID=A0ABU4ZM93_9HYPH|nr:restriction endonuclease subunit S [Mesorhizobium sp. MSK_1335]MDX8525131.1 restriction endonuclease subunit S [Mesorhizobium sp. MSK_1335]